MGLFSRKSKPKPNLEEALEEKRSSRASSARVPTTDFRDAAKVEMNKTEPEATRGKSGKRHTVGGSRQSTAKGVKTKARQSEPTPPKTTIKTSKPMSTKKKVAVDAGESDKLNNSKPNAYVPPAKIVKPQAGRATKAVSHGPKPMSSVVNNLLKLNTQKLMGELTPEVQRAFETLFDRLDMTDSGGITAKEIQNLIKKHTDKILTVEQVQRVLADLDVRGTGDIEFDEFIFMLSQPENYVRLLDKKDIKDLETTTGKTFKQPTPLGKSDPTEVFFEALRNATRQDSMTALRVFYRNRLKKLNDHVIHDWSAGQRCIGLSDGEMLKRYETIQGELLRQRVNFCKDNSYKQSPYARPLEWGVVNLRQSIIDRQKQRREEQEQQTTEKTRRVKMSEFVVTPKAVPLPRYGIHRRSPLKRTFDYDQLAGIREKVDDIALKYYTELKVVASDNSAIVKKELAVDEIKGVRCRQNFTQTFTAYCAPFVVSPWIPMPSPTLQASFAPLGKSKHSVQK